jgi:hypothetical protein
MLHYFGATNNYFEDFWQQVVESLPRVIGALLLLLIGYMIAKAVSALVGKTLQRSRLDEHVHSGQGGNVIQRAIPHPSNFAASITFWIIYLFAISVAVSALGIPALVEFVRGIYSYLPNVLAAILIFLAASAISALVATLAKNTMGDTPTGKVVATAGPLLVMGLAVFMILNQLKIAPEIVTLTYAALVGGMSLGMALAFGLGGREVAGRILEGLYDKGVRNKSAIADDFKKGGRNAKRNANEARENI